MKILSLFSLMLLSLPVLADSYTCNALSRNQEAPKPYVTKILIHGSQIQVSDQAGKNIYFDNFNGQIAYSGNKSISKVSDNGQLYFVVSDWGKPVNKIKEKEEPIYSIGFGDCGMGD